jgi:hypothetical protein
MVLITWEDAGSIKNYKYYLNRQEKQDYIKITIVNKEPPLEENAPLESNNNNNNTNANTNNKSPTNNTPQLTNQQTSVNAQRFGTFG